jgi:acetyltransferase-like isoleucine patch superfamily enzyme
MTIDERLNEVRRLVEKGIEKPEVERILQIMDASDFPSEVLTDMRLYSEYLPKAQEFGLTNEQRYLHFLWDALDRYPLGVVANFAIPFRRIIAQKLFKKCGKNFIAEEHVRFNFGQNIEIGDDVFFNRGVYLDAKGGIKIGNYAALAEGVQIFTHGHSEALHTKRDYSEVIICDFAKIMVNALLLPGVTIGEEALVGGFSVVSKDVPPGMMVAGNPARVVRERRSEGNKGLKMDHIWLHESAFQID